MSGGAGHDRADPQQQRSHGVRHRNVDAPATSDPRCDLCGAPVLDRHCKLVCTRCGYQRDCSDP